MNGTDTIPVEEPQMSITERLLGGIERAGNKVPHPVMMFLYLIGIVMILSVVLDALNVGVTEEVAVPVPPPAEAVMHEPMGGIEGGTTDPSNFSVPSFQEDFVIETQRIEIRSLLTVEGIRFIF